MRERFPPLRAQLKKCGDKRVEQESRGQATWNKKAGDKRRGARLQTCRVAIPGDMSLLATPALSRNLVLQALEARRPSHVHVAWFP